MGERLRAETDGRTATVVYGDGAVETVVDGSGEIRLLRFGDQAQVYRLDTLAEMVMKAVRTGRAMCESAGGEVTRIRPEGPAPEIWQFGRDRRRNLMRRIK